MWPTRPTGAGGIGIYGGSLVIENSTVTGNVANDSSPNTSGGGIDAFGSGVTIYDTIVAGNTGSAANPSDVSGYFTSLGHNLIGSANSFTTGFGASDLVGTVTDPIDPRLGPLRNNGGPTPTVALLPGSPAIDTGSNANAPLLDQRGLARIVNGTVDIGAFEVQRYVVSNTDDNGPGSFRQAILDNNTAGQGIIVFAIGTGPQTITPADALPVITEPVDIDGTTQPGYSGEPPIELDGANAGNADGLVISAGNSVVRGLVIDRFSGNGIVLESNGGNLIAGNHIGTDQSSTLARGNGNDGILITGGNGNTIGGTAPGAANTIAYNGSDGVNVAGGADDAIEGNLIFANGARSGST